MPFELNIWRLQLEGARSAMCMDGDVWSGILEAFWFVGVFAFVFVFVVVAADATVWSSFANSLSPG